MRSRAARLTVGAIAWIAIAAAAFFVSQSEQRIVLMRGSARAFDLRVREASDALAEIRAGQEAYVATGQGAAFWMRKVSSTLEATRQALLDLRQSAASGNARAALDGARTTADELGAVDARARDYLKSGQTLMAGDVLFTEGGAGALKAARQLESARLAERQATDASEAAIRRQEAIALGAAGLLTVLVVLLLVPRGATPVPERLSVTTPEVAVSSGRELLLREAQPPAPKPEVSASGAAGRAVSPVLRAAAELCTDFGRLMDAADLTRLLERAAELMDASGVIVWLGSAAGADLRPALTHGYTAQAVARIPPLPRSGDNAAAAAYRSGLLQIVPSRPGSTSGAVVAPILAAGGCIGALSAEIRHGGESSDSVQALAAICAAQLAGVLSSPPASSAGDGQNEPRAATAS